MKLYIIDGNNLIGKISAIKNLQKKDKQKSREKLAFIVDNYFSNKKSKVYLHFDGHPNAAIKINNAKIIYSENVSADIKIKNQVGKSKNPRNLIVVTSDKNLAEYARVCSSTVIKSEDFATKILHRKNDDEEKRKINSMSNTDEFKKLFGV